MVTYLCIFPLTCTSLLQLLKLFNYITALSFEAAFLHIREAWLGLRNPLFTTLSHLLGYGHALPHLARLEVLQNKKYYCVKLCQCNQCD